jgi:Na+/H+-dicarboxylate symporter
MFAVIVAIDWFIDRFRTAVNVSGDFFALAVVTKIVGQTDEDDIVEMEVERQSMDSAARDNTALV